MHVALHFDDGAEMARKFDACRRAANHDATAGYVLGAKFGMVTDAHGVAWMFNCETRKPWGGEGGGGGGGWGG